MALLRGALPSARNKLAGAMPHRPPEGLSLPSTFLLWPKKMSLWGNDQFGDCVTAEEALAKATAEPQVFFDDTVVISWARRHGMLNGAELIDVLQMMQRHGFGKWEDGDHFAVDWKDEEALHSAIFQSGPVKLGVAAGELQKFIQGDPPASGWVIPEYPSGLPLDHCTSLLGWAASPEEMRGEFAKHEVEVAGVLPPDSCYAMFTWGSVGVVTKSALLAMVGEAWMRSPVTKERGNVP